MPFLQKARDLSPVQVDMIGRLAALSSAPHGDDGNWRRARWQ